MALSSSHCMNLVHVYVYVHNFIITLHVACGVCSALPCHACCTMCANILPAQGMRWENKANKGSAHIEDSDEGEDPSETASMLPAVGG